MQKYNKTNWVANETLVAAENLNKIEKQLEILTNEFIESNSQLDNVTNQFSNKVHLVSNNNLTTDDINKAINSIDSGIIELSGTFNSIGYGIKLKSNIQLIGVTNAVIQGNNWLCNANITETNTIKIENISIDNITFKHLDGIFKENVGQLLLANVNNVIINNCKFIGSKSDAISIGGGIIYGIISHNHNVTITNCLFDGVNNQNRNAITLSDIDNCLIDNNVFINFTRENMPGAIDMEMDSDENWVLRNIKILNNKFTNIGGNTGVIAMISFCQQSKLKKNIENIIIKDNIIQDSIHSASGIYLLQTSDDSNIKNNVIIENNTFKNIKTRSFLVRGLNGVKIKNNRFLGSNTTSLIGYNTDKDICKDIEICENYFYKNAKSEGTGISIFDVTYLNIHHNIFDSIGKSDKTFGYVLSFDSNLKNSNYLSFENNTILSGDNTTKGIILWGNNYKSDTNTNIYRNNLSDITLLNYFKYKKDFQFYSNDFVFNSSTLPDSFPLGVTVTTILANDSNLPTGVNFGIIETLKFTREGAYRTTIYQRLYSDASGKPTMYLRKATWNANTWEQWHKIY